MLIINIYSAIQPRSFECFSYFINSKNSVFIGNIRLMGKDMGLDNNIGQNISKS